MFCTHCGAPLRDGAKFCEACGASQPQNRAAKDAAPKREKHPPKEPPAPKKRSGAARTVLIAALVLVLALACGFGLFKLFGEKTTGPSSDRPTLSTDETKRDDASGNTDDPSGSTPADGDTSRIQTLVRPRLLQLFGVSTGTQVTPSVAPYAVSSDRSELVNADHIHLSDEMWEKLEENLFVVGGWGRSEFFEIYEDNRYDQTPNFVTVDSMMHTYHLYFSLLLNRTEKEYLSAQLAWLSDAMLDASIAQYETLAGSEWETAAARNVAFFAVGALLQDDSTAVPDYAQQTVTAEYDAISAAQGIDYSALTGELLDYSQFKPRGYYAGDETLERYFRAMMWYGQINFSQKDEDLNRSALLMTLAMRTADLDTWEQIYTVTSCFAGASDDLSYYEYEPAIEKAYAGASGDLPATGALINNGRCFDAFQDYISEMKAPQINSIPVVDPDGTVDLAENGKGFRFMGQRFTIDAAIMQQLVYYSVKENSSGERRMLPDTLDMAAALGSDTALDILSEQGETDYENYSEKMDAVREAVQDAPEELWSASLYAGWLYTLSPLLEEKGDGWPAFMQSEQWAKKSLETYCGSFTELKHDTVLYAKQVMAEMGGGPMEELDDRGYVEPEYEVYSRFMQLAQQTSDGLSALGMLSDADRENLSRLASLAEQLMTISEKELRGETLTDAEYDLIRDYGGTLEHFWIEAVKDKSESPYLDSREIPASLVTDLATDPNGSVLEIANGRPIQIYVAVPVDGTLRIAVGAVYDFYQFTQPLSDRLTDKEWRQMSGEWALDDGTYNWDAKIDKPWWTESYRAEP